MGSESKNRNGDAGGGAAQGMAAATKKVVQSLKEIVNCAEQEIYAVLKECDMYPDRAVERLLAQDTFQEVKSKRERRKEMKEALDSRSSANVGLSRGGKVGSERNVVQSGSTQGTYNEISKAADKREVWSVCPSVSSSTTLVVWDNTNSDYFSTDNGRQSLGTGDSISVIAQVSPGLQTSCLGVRKGQLSMADVVRMGRPSEDAVSHYHAKALGVSVCGKSESSSSLPCQNDSEQPIFLDEWPVIEQPITGISQASNISASSNANEPFEHPSLSGTAASLCRNCELDAAQVSQVDVADDNVISDKIGSASVASKHTVMSIAGLGSHSNYNLYNTGSSDFDSSYELHKDFQRLCIRDPEQEVPSSEDNCTVVLPNHVQALAAECSHLSFGTYNGGSSSASSPMLAYNLSGNGLEEKAAAVDGSLAQYLDARHFLIHFKLLIYSALSIADIPSFVYCNSFSSSFCNSSVNYGEQLGFDVLQETAGYKSYDFLSSPQQELVKRIVPEATFGHEYNTMPSVLDPSFQKFQWVTPSLTFKRRGLESGNLSNFPREMVMKPGAFAAPHRFARLQDLTVQSLTHLEQLANTREYHSQPQNQPYRTAINSQQTFSGSFAYNQSSAGMNYNLPQNRNEFLSSRLPTARDAFGYGNLGSFSYNPGSFLSNPSPGHLPSSNFDQILPSHYNGARNLSSIQQCGGFSSRGYGAESRSSSLPSSTHYSFLGQPNQAPPLQYKSPGYSDLYHSQTQVGDELQQPGSFQDLSSKQSHQFWKHSH